MSSFRQEKNVKISVVSRRVGAASAGLFTASVLVFGAPLASADPITDLLCNAGSSQLCAQQSPQANPAPQSPSVYYKNCDEVRAAGKAPLRKGDPGYAAHLDRDSDGIACE